MAELGYGLLVLDACRTDATWGHEQYPNVFMATLAVTGFVVARQVRRIWSLSTSTSTGRAADRRPGAGPGLAGPGRLEGGATAGPR